MPRPRKPRFVSSYPAMESFVPGGREPSGCFTMTVEEFETIRLSDFEGLDQETASTMMGISRHTYGRLLTSARRAVAQALVTGGELRVEGGHFEFRGQGRCRRRGQRQGRGQGCGRRQQRGPEEADDTTEVQNEE